MGFEPMIHFVYLFSRQALSTTQSYFHINPDMIIYSFFLTFEVKRGFEPLCSNLQFNALPNMLRNLGLCI